jgi:hypothetical protein
MSATVRYFNALLRPYRLNQDYGWPQSSANVQEIRWIAGVLIRGGYSSDFDHI